MTFEQAIIEDVKVWRLDGGRKSREAAQWYRGGEVRLGLPSGRPITQDPLSGLMRNSSG